MTRRNPSVRQITGTPTHQISDRLQSVQSGAPGHHGTHELGPIAFGFAVVLVAAVALVKRADLRPATLLRWRARTTLATAAAPVTGSGKTQALDRQAMLAHGGVGAVQTQRRADLAAADPSTVEGQPNRPWSRRLSQPWVVVGGLTLVAGILRFIVPRGLWSDEAISVVEARLHYGTMLTTLRLQDVHPPLYFSILWVDIRLLGSGELAVRVPSIIAGTLIVPVAYLTALACRDRRAGYSAAVLAVAAPLLVWYSQEARMYSMYMLFALVAIWAQVRCLQDGRRRYWLVLGLAVVALFYNQYFGLIQVAGQTVAFLAVFWSRRRTAGIGTAVRRAVVTGIGAAILMAPLVPFAAQQFSRTSAHPFNGVSASTGNKLDVYNIATLVNWAAWGYHSNSIIVGLNTLWPVVMLGALILLGRRLDYRVRLLGWCIVMPIGVLFALGQSQPNLFDVRYVASIVPLLYVFAGVLISITTRRLITNVVVVGVLVGASLVALVNQQYSWSNPRLFDFHHTIDWVKARYRPGDLVVFGPNGLQKVLQYYAPRLPTEYIGSVGQVGHPARVFLIVVPPLYTSSQGPADAAFKAGLGRTLVARYDGANVDVLEYR